jgi:hypothetical protein
MTTTTTAPKIPRHGAKARERLDLLRGPRLAALLAWMQANDGQSPSLETLKGLWGYKSRSTALYYVRYLVAQYDVIIMARSDDDGETYRANEANQYLITGQGLGLAKAAQND